MGGPNSTGITRAPAYSGNLHRQTPLLRLQDCHPLRSAFPIPFNWRARFVTVREICKFPLQNPITPTIATLAGLHARWFRLLPFRSPLLRESLRFLLYPATEMFHFADFAPASRVSGMRRRGYPIRRPSDQGPFAPTRRFSQLTASFIADKCQGIHRVPLVLFSPSCRCLLFSCQSSQGYPA